MMLWRFVCVCCLHTRITECLGAEKGPQDFMHAKACNQYILYINIAPGLTKMRPLFIRVRMPLLLSPEMSHIHAIIFLLEYFPPPHYGIP